MVRKIAVASILLFVSWACFGLNPKEIRAGEDVEEIPVPKITQFFAAKQIKPGGKWKIYLNVSCPGGKMERIVATVDQPGLQVGSYPASFTKIKKGNQQEFSGYVVLNIPPRMNQANIKLTVQIQASPKGWFSSEVAYSEPLVLPLRINHLAAEELPPSGVFQDIELGPIMIQLQPTSHSEAHERTNGYFGFM